MGIFTTLSVLRVRIEDDMRNHSGITVDTAREILSQQEANPQLTDNLLVSLSPYVGLTSVKRWKALKAVNYFARTRFPKMVTVGEIIEGVLGEYKAVLEICRANKTPLALYYRRNIVRDIELGVFTEGEMYKYTTMTMARFGHCRKHYHEGRFDFPDDVLKENNHLLPVEPEKVEVKLNTIDYPDAVNIPAAVPPTLTELVKQRDALNARIEQVEEEFKMATKVDNEKTLEGHAQFMNTFHQVGAGTLPVGALFFCHPSYIHKVVSKTGGRVQSVRIEDSQRGEFAKTQKVFVAK